ncbi:hypothetical protein AgCh_031278 [Apium graveolens]
MGGGHGQGSGFSSRRAEATSHRKSSDTGRRITSDTGKRISSDELLDLDEEITRQLFLKENPRMDFESLMEEEARLKSERVNSKSEASVGKKTLPKAKGIVIKERTNPEATKDDFDIMVKSSLMLVGLEFGLECEDGFWLYEWIGIDWWLNWDVRLIPMYGRRLPCHQVTNFLDIPALGRRQPPYMVLRLCGDLHLELAPLIETKLRQ